MECKRFSPPSSSAWFTMQANFGLMSFQHVDSGRSITLCIKGPLNMPLATTYTTVLKFQGCSKKISTKWPQLSGWTIQMLSWQSRLTILPMDQWENQMHSQD